MNNLILFGFKGCGKSYFGKLLAAFLHLSFIDTDQLIEETYFERYHVPLSCTQIGLEKGTPFFRALEKECIHQLGNVTHSVISLGGGSILDPDNVIFLKNLGKMVYLKADKELLKKRMFANELPFFIDRDHPEESFEKMYQDRKAKYEAIQGETIALQNKADKEVLEEISVIYGQ